MNWVKPQGAPITATVSYEPGLSNVGVGIAGQHFDYLVPRISMEEIVPGVYQATIYATIYGAPGDYFVVFDNDGEDWQWEHLTLTASVYLPGESDPEPEPTDAIEELARLVAADQVPTLNEADLQSILATAVRPDSEGRAPSDEGWTPTYDLNAAAAEGWQRKAGLAASKFDFAEDDQRFNVGQIHNHCIAMANQYRRKIVRSVKSFPVMD